MKQLAGQLCFGYRADHYQEILDWKRKHPNQKLYVWGVGSVANGAIHELEKRKIHVDGCFVNVPSYHIDTRVEKRKLPVFQLDRLLAQMEEFLVVIGHSHYELAETLRCFPQIQKIWALNNVAREDADITEDFLKENLTLFENTYTKLEDEASRKNMEAYLNAQVTKDDHWILSVFEKTTTYFENDVISLAKDEVYLDLGAYNGDSMKKFIEACPDYKQILAVEVQPSLYHELIQKWGSNPRVSIYHTGVSRQQGQEYFHFDDQSTYMVNNSAGEGILAPVTTVDALCSQIPTLTVIKICIGNTIIPLLEGASQTLKKHHPKLVISAGIDRRALMDYIPKIEALAGEGSYQYYLRFTNAMEECLVLYAVPRKE